MSLTTEQLRALCIKHAVRPDKNGDIPRNFWNALSELNGMVGGGEPVAYMVPTSRVTHDGSMEEGPEYLVPAHRANDYEKRVGTPFYTAPAPTPAPAVEPLSRERVREICAHAGYDHTATVQERAAFVSGIRHGEAAHGIGAQKGGA